MAINITPTEANSFLINNKEVYKDANNNWISREDLTPEEFSAFYDHIQMVEKKKKIQEDAFRFGAP